MSVEAERSLIGRMLANPRVIAEVTAARLDVDDFSDPALKKLYATLVENFYADDPVDPLSIGALTQTYLSRVWGVSADKARQTVIEFGAFNPTGRTGDHIALVRRTSNARRVMTMLGAAQRAVQEGERAPEEIAGSIAQEAVKIATGGVDPSDTITFEQAGENFLAETKRDRAAKERGIELGVKFGIGAIDGHTHGLQPTELLIGAGEPGVGKSGVWWRAGLNFAEGQAKRERERQVATLILSLEMGEKPSSQRIASMISAVDMDKFREGTVTDADMRKVQTDWLVRRSGLPLVLSHRTGLKASGVRALISDAVLRFNVGLVIIDHFRMFQMDDPPRNSIDHDEEKVVFLKEQIAKAMNLAVVCLAHTRKIPDERKGRPGPSDLRGSDQIRAHADFVNFLYRPGLYATEDEIDRDPSIETEAMFIWGKNRHGNTRDSRFFLDPRFMSAW